METVIVKPTTHFFATIFGNTHAYPYAEQNFSGKTFPLIKDGEKYFFKKKPFIKTVSGDDKNKVISLNILLNSLPETFILDESCFEEVPDAIE